MYQNKQNLCINLSATLTALLVALPSAMGQVPTTLKMDLPTLRKGAWNRCQSPWKKPQPPAVPVLDPPTDDSGVGMDFKEELEVQVKNNFLDPHNGEFMRARPRAALNNLGMNLYVDRDNSGVYELVRWEDQGVDYSSPLIKPAINIEDIPAAGRVLTEYVIGHYKAKHAEDPNDTDGYPQLFDVRSNGYVRFQGYDFWRDDIKRWMPQVPGASFRLGAHKLWSLIGGKTEQTDFNWLGHFGDKKNPINPAELEDFPVIRSAYTSLPTANTSRSMIVLEGELFCAALDLTMTEGQNPEILVDGYWYTRKDFKWKDDPHTGFVAYSSMHFQDGDVTPLYDGDEAHDSDKLTVYYADGGHWPVTISNPDVTLRVRDLSNDTPGQEPVSWTLANEDRNPSHYSYFEGYWDESKKSFNGALGNSGYYPRVSYRVDVLESTIRKGGKASRYRTGVQLYEHHTENEFLDNIVAVSTARQDIPKAKTPDDWVHFKYKTSSYYPNPQ